MTQNDGWNHATKNPMLGKFNRIIGKELRPFSKFNFILWFYDIFSWVLW
jgi:hypothetical protein